MAIDAVSFAASGLAQGQAATEMQVKLAKGAMEQEGKIALQLVDSAASAPAPRAHPTGRLIDVEA